MLAKIPINNGKEGRVLENLPSCLSVNTYIENEEIIIPDINKQDINCILISVMNTLGINEVVTVTIKDGNKYTTYLVDNTNIFKLAVDNKTKIKLK